MVTFFVSVIIVYNQFALCREDYFKLPEYVNFQWVKRS